MQKKYRYLSHTPLLVKYFLFLSFEVKNKRQVFKQVIWEKSWVGDEGQKGQ